MSLNVPSSKISYKKELSVVIGADLNDSIGRLTAVCCHLPSGTFVLPVFALTVVRGKAIHAVVCHDDSCGCGSNGWCSVTAIQMACGTLE